MADIHGAQKFVGRNRPPRVQIECDEDIDGAQIKVNLPFVAGVMADLCGKWADLEEIPEEHRSARGDLAEERKFLEIDQDNFGARMKAIQPTVSFNVPNTITGEGNIPVNLTFESMADFEPDKIAARLEPLKDLFEARKALGYLKDKASNKAALEKLLQKLAVNPKLVKALVDAAKLEKS